MSEGISRLIESGRTLEHPSDCDPEDAEERYGTILDHLKEGFQVLSPDWRYLYVNDAVIAQGRSTREALLGRPMGEAYPGIEQTLLFAVLERCMRERRPAEFVNEFVYPDGRTGWFELRIAPVPEGLAILSVDITAHKRMEAELAARTAELAASQRMLREITYAAAHDLQTPLRRVLSFSDPDLTQPGGLGALTRIHEAATRMHERLEALVAYTEAERGERPRPVDVGPLVQQTLTELWPLAEGAGGVIETEIDEGVATLAAGALCTALWAFCHNALTFHGPDDPPRVMVRVALDAESCVLTVRDEGIGVPAAHLRSIWQAFYRVREAGDYPGLGVGLARARVAVESAGGTVQAHSTFGRGSTFVARLPLGGCAG